LPRKHAGFEGHSIPPMSQNAQLIRVEWVYASAPTRCCVMALASPDLLPFAPRRLDNLDQVFRGRTSGPSGPTRTLLERQVLLRLRGETGDGPAARERELVAVRRPKTRVPSRKAREHLSSQLFDDAGLACRVAGLLLTHEQTLNPAGLAVA
jgi:hypothetical protein